MATWFEQFGNWNTKATAGLLGGSFGKGLGSLGINGSNIGGIANTIGQIGTGLLAGQNETGIGNAMQTIGGLASNIPGVGGLIGAGVGVLGGLVNAAFGSNINDEFVAQTENQANQLGNRIFGANTNGDLLNDWQNMVMQSNVSKSEVGSDGWFSSKASDKTRELNRQIDEANARQLANFNIAAQNVDAQNDLRILQNMAAYGGPINSFRKYYSFGGPFGNYFEGEGEQSNSLRSPYVDLAVSNPWLYTKLHPSKKTKKAYKPTTFAGRVAQVAGAGELGQKYVDYASSVFQQVPVVGLGISALDLGYDINNLYHAPSWTTAKDVGLDAASLLPAFRKTMKGWWMKGNSGSFITEGGQIINNPRLASSLEVMLQPYRTAVNTGIYAGRAADFIDDSKAYLKEMWNGSPIGKAVNQHSRGGYLNQAKALIRQNEGWRDKPYNDAPKGKNWRSVGYGFNDSGFRDKYPEGISKHYEHGITKKQAEEELDYFLSKAEKQLKSIYGKQWNDFTDSQKAAILDTYYQRPASVAKGSRFYKAITSGEDAGRYLGVAGYDKRNKIRQGVFGGDYSGYSDTEPNPSTLQEVTPIPVIQNLDLEGITPTQAKALELNLTSPTFDLSMFGKPSAPTVQPTIPTVGTVEDFLASYGDFEDNLFKEGGNLYSDNNPNGQRMITTGGAGYVPQNNIDIKSRLYENLSPIGYEDLSRVPKAILLNKADIFHNDMKNMPVLDEIYAQYLGIPEKDRHFNKRLEKSKYKPSQGGEDVTYYRLPQKTIDGRTILGDDHKYTGASDTSVDAMIFDATYMEPGTNKQQLNTELGYYTVGRGRDNKGDYVSYYDKWDINPFSGRLQNNTALPLSVRKILKDINLDFGIPVNIYDRIHFDDYYDIQGGDRGGHYLPEVIVTGKKRKKAFGGNLFEDGGKPNIKDMNIFDFGGGLTHRVGDTVDISPEEARYLKSLGYEFKVIG